MYYNLNNFYQNYGSKIVEQSATLSDDADTKLKQYLEDDEFIEYLVGVLPTLEEGEDYKLSIDREKYGILPDDKIWARLNKLEGGKNSFTMWIMNDKVLYGGIDFNAAATLLYQAGQEGGVVGYVGNLLGSLVGAGDPGDAGTDEETVVAVAGAMAALAAERGADPKIYYDKLSETFNSKYGSMANFLETEFSGSAETIALATFRQPISPSVARGINLGSILLDIGLTIATFGGGTAVGTAIRGSGAAAKGAVASTRVGSKVIKAGNSVLTGTKGVLSRIPGWSKLAGSSRATYLGKEIKVGETINYMTKTGKNAGKASPTKVLAIAKDGVQLQGANKVIFKASHSDFILGIDPGLANKILNGANISATKAGLALATKKTADAVGAGAVDQGAEGPSFVGQAAEVMGWYDTLAADPNAYAASLAEQDAASLAEAILNLKKGSGLFGNTTAQEELAMAIIITSLTPDGAKKVAAEYNKIDPSMSVYAVIDDELGGDLGMFAKAYWSACTGEGAYAGPVKNILSKITSK
jgi:hypothetical protein